MSSIISRRTFLGSGAATAATIFMPGIVPYVGAQDSRAAGMTAAVQTTTGRVRGLTRYGVIQPAYGSALTVKAFIITVLAGVGSIPGVLLGAVLLGVAEALTVTLASSALQELAGMMLFLLVLFAMPNGLMGASRRRG